MNHEEQGYKPDEISREPYKNNSRTQEHRNPKQQEIESKRQAKNTPRTKHRIYEIGHPAVPNGCGYEKPDTRTWESPQHHHPDHAAPAEKHNFAFPLSARIRTWVKFYNWHNIGHLTHPLVFQQKFSEEISALVLDMEMNGQKMRGELIMKHYENALGLCGKIDTLCRQGCKNEDDVRTLEQLCRIIQRPINGLADLIDGYCRLDIEAEQSKLEQTRLTTRTQRTPPFRTGSAAPAMPYDQAGVGGSSNLDSESLRQVEWNQHSPEYIANSEAIKLAQGEITLSILSKALTPGGPIRYMRNGQRCRVHIQDFRAYIKTLKKDLSDASIDKRLAEIEKTKAAIKAQKGK